MNVDSINVVLVALALQKRDPKDEEEKQMDDLIFTALRSRFSRREI